MIEALDEFFEKFLAQELSTLNYTYGDIKIAFDQPKQEWSTRISAPTLNIFLYDIRENQKLRQTQPPWDPPAPDAQGNMVQRRRPVRLDLHYLITAWGTSSEDEHRLLGRTMMALLRYPALPDRVMNDGEDTGKNFYFPADLRADGKAVPLLVAQYEELPNPSDMWNVLDNQLRPAIACTLTVALNPYAQGELVSPLVRKRALTVGELQMGGRIQKTDTKSFWTIGGHLDISRKVDMQDLSLTLVETGLAVPLQPDGRFVIGRLREGTYQLEVKEGSNQLGRFPIEVPSADFEIHI